MSMNIPEETIRKAREVCAATLTNYLAINGGLAAAQAVIASALHSAQMEERERCAKIAENFDAQEVLCCSMFLSLSTPEDIATAIRTTKAD